MAEVNDESTRRLQNGHQALQNLNNIRTRENASSDGSSDSEDGERPVRDKLKKTSIAGLSSKARAGTDRGTNTGPQHLQDSAKSDPAQPTAPDRATSSSRGRPAKKRSFDDLQDDGSATASQAELDNPPPAKDGHHKRMRSRDISSGEHVSLPGVSDNGIATTLEEESDMDAQKSPEGLGVLVDATSSESVTMPPEISPAPVSMIIPKKKRSREQFDKEEVSTIDASQLEQKSTSQKESEPEKKRYREEEQAVATVAKEPTKSLAPESGFSNASTASPFGNFASPKKSTLEPEAKHGESDAFKSSGLSAFASLDKSPFGAARSTSTLSGFGSTTSSGGFGQANPVSGLGASMKSPFGNAGAISPFGGVATSSFGSLGALPFASPYDSTNSFVPIGRGGGSGGPPGVASTPFSDGRSAFGDPTVSTTAFARSGTTKQRAFGAPEADDDSGSGADSDSPNDEGGGEAEENHAREARLKEQTDRETGEEDEEVIIKCRAKLYHFENKEWKERGVGDLKVNVRFDHKDSSDEEGSQFKRKGRIIMRTEHVHRVVLNTPIFKGMKVGNQNGDEPNGKFLNLAGTENGKPALFMLKIGREELVKELYQRIRELQEDP